MDFTIITPSLDYGHYIEECLKSVASQEGVTFEHLVMDAGSKDDTTAVVSRYPHATFFQEPDEGMSDGINIGFRKATGNWIMWLNADDSLKPGALKAVKDFASAKSDVDVIYGCFDFVDGNGEFTRRMTLFPFQKSMLLYLGCYIPSTSTFFRRKTTTDEGHFLNIDYRYVMDGEYYARLAHLGKKFAYLPRVLANFRIHGSNLSKRNYGGTGASAWLKLQKQFAETRAYRRTYGKPPFSDENLNTLVDSLFYIFFRVLKPVLKIYHSPKVQG